MFLNKYKNVLEKRKYIAILTFIAFIIAGIIIYDQFNTISYDVEIVTIQEPEAPITTSLNVNEFAIPKQNDSANQEVKVETIAQFKKIEILKYSPDKTKILVLYSDENTQQENISQISKIKNTIIPKINAQSVTSPYFKLAVATSNGDILTKVERKNIIDASFVDNSNLVFQTADNNSGIFKINLEDKKETLVLDTNDPSVFNNIQIINNNDYFFIQPSTGKIGFGQLGSDEAKILDEKILNTKSSYVRAGAYKLAGISPDKKLIAFFDASDVNDKGKTKLIIINSNAVSLKNPYFQTYVYLSPRGLKTGESIYKWQGNYLNVGDDGTLIDIKNKKIVFSSDDYIKLKSNNALDKYLINNLNENKLYLEDKKENTKIEIAENVTDFEFISEDIIILKIGNNIYNYNISQKGLEKVTENNSETQILNSDINSGAALIRKGNSLQQITIK